MPNNEWVSLEFCQKKLNDHFKFLNLNKVETLYFHDIKILFNKEGKKIFKNLEILRKKIFSETWNINLRYKKFRLHNVELQFRCNTMSL